MSQEIKSIPKWILIVSWLYALLTVVTIIVLIVSPETAYETIDLKAKGVDFLIHMLCSRHFALAFVLGFSALKKSVPMLTISYILLLVTLIGDFVVGISQRESPLIISAAIVAILAAIMIYFVNKQSK